MEGQAKHDVVFSNKERVWMSVEDVNAADVAQWTEAWNAGEKEEEEKEDTKLAAYGAQQEQSGQPEEAWRRASPGSYISELERQLEKQLMWRAAQERAERNQRRLQQDKKSEAEAGEETAASPPSKNVASRKRQAGSQSGRVDSRGRGGATTWNKEWENAAWPTSWPRASNAQPRQDQHQAGGTCRETISCDDLEERVGGG
jgi:hypothetical protein